MGKPDFRRAVLAEMTKAAIRLREAEAPMQEAAYRSFCAAGTATAILTAQASAALLKAQEETMMPSLPSFSEVVHKEAALKPKPREVWPAPDRASCLFSRPWRLRGARSTVLVLPDVLSNAARRIVAGMMETQPYTLFAVRAVCISEGVPLTHSRICADRLLQTMRRAGLIEYVNQSWRVKG